MANRLLQDGSTRLIQTGDIRLLNVSTFTDTSAQKTVTVRERAMTVTVRQR